MKLNNVSFESLKKLQLLCKRYNTHIDYCESCEHKVDVYCVARYKTDSYGYGCCCSLVKELRLYLNEIYFIPTIDQWDDEKIESIVKAKILKDFGILKRRPHE